MKTVIWGLGRNYYFMWAYIHQNFDDIILTDNNDIARERVKSSCLYRGEPIIAPSEIINIRDDVKVVITIAQENHRMDIRQQLDSMGVRAESIEDLLYDNVGDFLLDPLCFKPNISFEEKEKLFLYNVEHITIEVNSRCNRKCWFCPNSVLDRMTDNYEMSWELFEKIIHELKRIDYSGVVTYSFYNEPLLDGSLAKRISFVKEKLPNCRQLITTNGDYLDKETLDNIIEAGLDYLIISVYEKNDVSYDWTREDAKNSIERIIKRAEIPISYSESSDEVVVVFGKKQNCFIRLQDYDFRLVGHNRGEILDANLPLKKQTARTDVCCNGFVTLNIYYTGECTICGNMRPDWEPHKQFIIGDVNKDSIFDVFASEKARSFRTKMCGDINVSPCNSCTRNGGGTFIPIYPGAEILKRPRYRLDK